MTDAINAAYDVMIIGGGPAGAAAAITLARYSTLRVALVDRAREPAWAVGEAVSPALSPLLHYLGLDADAVAAEHLPAYGHAAAWGSASVQSRDYLFGGQGPGLHLDRTVFDATLRQHAATLGVAMYPGTQPVVRAAGWKVELQRADAPPVPATARYLIDASGRTAALARYAGAARHKFDRLVAVCAYYAPVRHEASQQGTFVEATEDGWYYAAPLPNQRFVVCFLTDQDVAQQLQVQHRWTERLQATPQLRRLAAYVQLGPPVHLTTRAAHTQLTAQPTGAGWIAAGEAAAAFDPLSSMGIGFAVSTGIEAARVAHAYCSQGEDHSAAYIRDVERLFGEYRRQQLAQYAGEARWPDAPFWQRRHAQHTPALLEAVH